MADQIASRDIADDEVTLLELLLILRDEWWVLVASVLTGVLVAIVLALTMSPVYRANVVVAEINSAGVGQSATSSLLGQLGGLAGLAGVNLRGFGNDLNNGRTIIQSRSFMEQFVKEQNLLPLLYPDLWDKDKNEWKADVNRPPALWQGANKFMREAFSFDEDSDTGLLTISVEWPDPSLASKWANRIVELANETARQHDIIDAGRSIAYLNDQIEKTNAVELQRVLYNLIETEQKTLMLANVRLDYVFRVVDPAIAPVTPAKPNRLFLLFLGVFAGGFLGLMIVFVRRVARGLREEGTTPQT